MVILCAIMILILWLFSVYINESWYKLSQEIVDALGETIDEYDEEHKKIHDILYDFTKSNQEIINEIRQIIQESKETK